MLTPINSMGGPEIDPPTQPLSNHNGEVSPSHFASFQSSAVTTPQGAAKGNALRLGANKASSSLAIDSLVNKLAEEAAESVTNPWGSDNLIDMNADADDWGMFASSSNENVNRFFAEGAFESGPTNVRPNVTTSTTNLIDFGTSLMAPSSSQLSGGLSTSTSSSQAQKPPPVIQRAQSPNPRSQPSQMSNIKNPEWGVNPLEIGEDSATPSTAVPSPAVMTKEEKALEMTRRKEERKQVCLKQASRGKISLLTFQRIAMLKEQKKAATKT